MKMTQTEYAKVTEAEYKELKKQINAVEKAIKTLNTAIAIANDNKDGDAVVAIYSLRAKLEAELSELKIEQLNIVTAI